MTDLRIERVNAGAGGAFVIRNPSGGEPELWAEMVFRWRDGVMVIVHTGVREQLHGQGVARRLVETAISLARDDGFLIGPQCRYAASVFRKGGDALADVLAPGEW